MIVVKIPSTNEDKFNRISPEIPLALGGGMNGDIILEKVNLFLNCTILIVVC